MSSADRSSRADRSRWGGGVTQDASASGDVDMGPGTRERRRLSDLLAAAGELVASGWKLDAVLQATVGLVQSMLGVRHCSILLHDEASGCLWLKASSHVKVDASAAIRVPLDGTISGRLFREGNPVLVADIRSSEFAAAAVGDEYPGQSFMAAPVTIRGRSVGIITAAGGAPESPFDPLDLQALVSLSRMIALAIENSQLFHASDSQRAHTENVIESLPMAVFTLDRSERLTYCNRHLARLLGVDETVLESGTSPETFLPESLCARLLPLCDEVLEFGVDRVEEVDFDSPVLGRIPVELRCSPLHDGESQTDGIVVSLSDLSVHREVDRLRRQDQSKANLLALLTHELRTPLTAIKGGLAVLRDSMGEPASPTAQTMLTIMDTNTDRLARLMRNLVELVLIQNGAMSLEPDWLDLADVVNPCVDDFAPQARAKNLRVRATSAHASVCVDGERFREAVGNMLQNAIHFAPRDSDICVVAECDGEYARIRIADEDDGASARQRLKTLSSLNRKNLLMEPQPDGSVIGLYVAHAIARMHGGKLGAGAPRCRGVEAVLEFPGAGGSAVRSRVGRAHHA